MVARYFRIWRAMVTYTFSVLAASRIDFLMFVPGKLLRMGFFVLLPLVLLERTPIIVGFERGEVLLFFAMMNFVDVFSQIFYLRGLNLMPMVVNRGDFDVVLTKPISPLFWTMFRVVDFFDVLTAPAAVAYLVFAWLQLPTPPGTAEVVAWLLTTALAFALSFAVVLTITAVNFWTTETENGHLLYRDAMNVSRYPPDVFPAWVKATLATVIPTLVIVSVPSLALMGKLELPVLVVALAATSAWTVIASLMWRAGLKRYTSASS